MVHVGAETISFSEAVRQYTWGVFPCRSLVITRHQNLNGMSHAAVPYYFAYGAAVSEVVVDLLTGENRLVRADLLHDAGKSINPAIDLGQIEGGFLQGAGWLTTEELVGMRVAATTHAPSTYKIPTCSDRPIDWRVSLFADENSEDTIYRSKAVGEPPLMLAISVWLALSDALSGIEGAEYPALDAPATPERLMMTARRLGAQFV